jgi:hypothetical protein
VYKEKYNDFKCSIYFWIGSGFDTCVFFFFFLILRLFHQILVKAIEFSKSKNYDERDESCYLFSHILDYMDNGIYGREKN